MSTLGSRLKACRKEAGLKQEAVCARVGIRQATLSELENDKYPTSSFVPHLAALYGVEAMWLAEGRGQKKRASVNNDYLSAQFSVAQNAEGVAIHALHDALKSGLKDEAELMRLTEAMTTAHDEKMQIWEKIQSLHNQT